MVNVTATSVFDPAGTASVEIRIAVCTFDAVEEMPLGFDWARAPVKKTSERTRRRVIVGMEIRWGSVR